MKKVDFTSCYGCGVCATACPKKAIAVEVNKDGFLQPIINSSCVECGICLKVCAFNDKIHSRPIDAIAPVSAAAWSLDEDVRHECTSGGVAYEIERHLISKGFKAVVVRYDIFSHTAEHYIASNEEELQDSVGSKYIQSNTYDAFSRLSNDEKYLVVGTPCQIDSLRRYIRNRKMEDNFILIDFFCHSVPSLNMWHKYLDIVGIKQIERVKFRCKRNGWHDSTTTNIHGDGREWLSSLSNGDLFYSFFLKDRCSNPACFKDCKYKHNKTSADLRIGDLWGRKYLNEERGVSSLVAFSQKGLDIINELKNCQLEYCDFSTASDFQLKANAKPPRSYRYVLKALRGKSSLKKIYKIAIIIELPDTIPSKFRYYIRRFPSKLKELFNLR